MGMEYSYMTAECQISLAKLTKIPESHKSSQSEQKKALDTMFTYLAEAINVYELCLGFDHPETADAYTKIAIAYQE